MQLRKVERKHAKIRLGLQGPSGSGKTMSALLIAYGLTNDWSKIAVIDTENKSADLYAHLGDYNVIPLDAPYTPERYIKAIKTCEHEGMEVIIIDSVSHEWEGIGGILDQHSNMAGNSFINWNKLTPLHNSFVNTILNSSAHVISTIRAKQDYVLVEKNGKQVPEKVGMKGITREGMDYELTLVLELDIKNNAQASKDRTGLFKNKPDFRITTETGAAILKWCMEGKPLEERIHNCATLEELILLYQDTPINPDVIPLFTQKKRELSLINQAADANPAKLANLAKFNQNGSINH